MALLDDELTGIYDACIAVGCTTIASFDLGLGISGSDLMGVAAARIGVSDDSAEAQ